MPDRDRFAQAEKNFLRNLASPFEWLGIGISVMCIILMYVTNLMWPKAWPLMVILGITTVVAPVAGSLLWKRMAKAP